jgi:hypothetical protein
MGLHKVRRAAYPQGAAIEPMGVDHRGADVLAPLQPMGGKEMVEGMAAGGFADPSCAYGLFDGSLYQRGIDGMAPLQATAAIPPAIQLGEHPRPAPISIGMGVFPRQGLRHQHLSPAGCQAIPMLLPHHQLMLAKLGKQALGQQRQAVLSALAMPHRELSSLDIQIHQPPL